MGKRDDQLTAKGKAAVSGVNLSHSFGISLQRGGLKSTTNSQLVSVKPDPIMGLFLKVH